MKDLWRGLGYLRLYWLPALGAVISLLLVTFANLFNPQILKQVIDQGINQKNLEVITFASLALVMVAIVRGIFSFTQGFWSEKASQGLAYDLRNKIFAQLENLSFSYHDKAQTGQLMTRVTNDVDQVRNFVSSSLLQVINALLTLVGSATILFLTNWKLALIAMAMVPVIFGVFMLFFRVVGPRFRLVQQKLGNLNTILQENLAGVRVVKAFGRETYEVKRYRAGNDDLLKENMVIVRGSTLTFPLIFFIANLGTWGVIWFGGSQVIDGQLTVGELIAFNTYLSFLLMPVFILGNTLTSLSQAGASAKRVFEVLDAPIEVSDKPGAKAIDHLHGRVAFENVSFRYNGSERASLENVSFVAEEGMKVAILGRTGAGKSSIINLIPRFYDANEGRVMLDEYDVRDLTLTSLRSFIGIVLQETVLFTGTIRENIAYGRPSASEAEIIEAAKAAQAHTFVTGFPQGYDTVVGERGVGLSGGQRQRIAIARALLLNPSMLILDDSTSAVDAETEYQIQQALQTLMQNRTSFIIAQRISTVRNANLILLLDNGQLVGKGSHEELLVQSPLYCELIESQLVSDETPAAA